MKGRDEGSDVRQMPFDGEKCCERESRDNHKDRDGGEHRFKVFGFPRHYLMSPEVMESHSCGAQREECES